MINSSKLYSKRFRSAITQLETLAVQALFLFKPALSESCYLFSVSIMPSV